MIQYHLSPCPKCGAAPGDGQICLYRYHEILAPEFQFSKIWAGNRQNAEKLPAPYPDPGFYTING